VLSLAELSLELEALRPRRDGSIASVGVAEPMGSKLQP
jgi:hypothetical protein